MFFTDLAYHLPLCAISMPRAFNASAILCSDRAPERVSLVSRLGPAGPAHRCSCYRWFLRAELHEAEWWGRQAGPGGSGRRPPEIGPGGVIASPFTRPSRYSGGSASTSSLSRPARVLLALRPAGLLNRLKRPLSRGFNTAGCPARLLVSYQINRQLSGGNFIHWCYTPSGRTE